MYRAPDFSFKCPPPLCSVITQTPHYNCDVIPRRLFGRSGLTSFPSERGAASSSCRPSSDLLLDTNLQHHYPDIMAGFSSRRRCSPAFAFCSIISAGELGPSPRGCSLNGAPVFLVPPPSLVLPPRLHYAYFEQEPGGRWKERLFSLGSPETLPTDGG